MSLGDPSHPNLSAYHATLSDEIFSISNRVRELVKTPDGQSHWLTDGEWKEAVLRSVLRRFLPEAVHVGRGFVVAHDYCSTQVDLLILRPMSPTLFRDGELVLVTPDAPAAIIEVKTGLSDAAQWNEAAVKLAAIGKACHLRSGRTPWLGIFNYNDTRRNRAHVPNAISKAYQEHGVAINCVSSGRGLFARFWPIGEYEPGDHRVQDGEREYWRTYDLENLAPSYFTSNLVEAVCGFDRSHTAYVWFPIQGGKRPNKIDEWSPKTVLGGTVSSPPAP
jgi:hypothetical protein